MPADFPSPPAPVPAEGLALTPPEQAYLDEIQRTYGKHDPAAIVGGPVPAEGLDDDLQKVLSLQEKIIASLSPLQRGLHEWMRKNYIELSDRYTALAKPAPVGDDGGLVERLRTEECTNAMMTEAANAIAALQARVDEAEATLQTERLCVLATFERHQTHRSKIIVPWVKKLRARLAAAEQRTTEAEAMTVNLERNALILRAEAAEQRAEGLAAEVERLAAEVERLKAELAAEVYECEGHIHANANYLLDKRAAEQRAETAERERDALRAGRATETAYRHELKADLAAAEQRAEGLAADLHTAQLNAQTEGNELRRQLASAEARAEGLARAYAELEAMYDKQTGQWRAAESRADVIEGRLWTCLDERDDHKERAARMAVALDKAISFLTQIEAGCRGQYASKMDMADLAKAGAETTRAALRESGSGDVTK